MWILVWLALEGQNVQYFHVKNFLDKDDCTKAMKEASVLVTNNNQTIDCIWIRGLDRAPSQKDILDQ